ncbi:major facilitator superfamily domain-containing protein [Ilyonectria robusta]|uniref:major facilitator superfamily domain-containing protein n=1 Tax=Ilyonectria robusta TaxID=1079257 RepID=UPI001E8D925B|nr:major facilitator superfamily domain-containing protein [Ilyonectria robusta]KAH8699666.1 major facilitator superfamily domain-containing protein [Ilyonectria robusta]
MVYDRVDSDDESELSDNLDLTEWQDESSREVDHDGLARLATEHDEPLPSSPIAPKTNHNAPVAWRDLPRKKQLLVITLARMSEPLVQSSLQAYMFYQLKWFDESLPDSTIATQAGILYASFTAAQFVTAMIWGRVADSPRAGRKTVLLIGLFGTCVSCLGFGFSTTFWQALLFRIIGGVTNGNVGVMRTMISEIIREKKYQSRAFLLLPMTFNVGVIIGPILGGILSDPAGSYPDLFGKVNFFLKFPYATPNIVSSVFLAIATLAVWLGLEETHDVLRDGRPDLGTRVGRKLVALLRSRFSRSGGVGYSAIPSSEVELVEGETAAKRPMRRYTQRLPFRRMFTRNVTMTLAANFLMGVHMGSFNSLWFVFLSTPVWDPQTSQHKQRLPFLFTGGLGLQPQSVGVAMAILGMIGITLQLVLYPRISGRLGTIRSWRISLLCFPVTYFLVPYLSVVPSSESSPPPGPKGGLLIWLAIVGVLSVQVMGRTFAIPGQTILVNNCSPHPSVLGSIHGVGQSVNSASRTVGPMIGGVIYGYGLNKGVVGLVWWILSCFGICGILASLLVREGNGHEIWLEGDEEEPSVGNPTGERVRTV